MDIAPFNTGLHPAGLNLKQVPGRSDPEDSPTPQNTRENTGDVKQPVAGPELQEIQRLAKRDREVRAHEQAHASVGGAYAGSPNYQYQVGPNGVRYAVGGHVSIDVSAVPGDPAATLQKMVTVRRAALAPQDPSPQDRAVAAKATRKLADARIELVEFRLEESYGQSPDQPEPGKVVDVSV